jgi:hypothetical protein
MVYVYTVSIAGFVLQLNTSTSFQTEGLQVQKYLAILHRLQDILSFASVSDLAKRPVRRDALEEGNIFQMIHRRWCQYAKDVHGSYSSEEIAWRTLHGGRFYPFRVQRVWCLDPDEL